MRQALRDTSITLTLAAGRLVATGIITYVFAGSVVAMVVFMAGAVVMATLGAGPAARLNVAQAYANAHPVGERHCEAALSCQSQEPPVWYRREATHALPRGVA